MIKVRGSGTGEVIVHVEAPIHRGPPLLLLSRGAAHVPGSAPIANVPSLQDGLAEWSKALASGASP